MKEIYKWYPGGSYEKILKVIWVLLFIVINPPIVNLLNFEEPYVLGIPFLVFWLLSFFILFGISIVVGAVKLRLPEEEDTEIM